MNRMKFLFSQLCLLALLALPLVATSCSDDEDLKVEIADLGVDDGTTIVTGQSIEFVAHMNNIQREVKYAWLINGEEVATKDSYTFKSDETGVYKVQLIVNDNNEVIEKSINITVIEPTFYVINEGQERGSINRYAKKNWQYDIVDGLGQTTTVGIIHNEYMYLVSKFSPFLVKMKLSDNSIVGSITEGDDNILGANGQGNNFCVVNDETGVLTTSNGAFKVNLSQMTLGDKLTGMDDARMDKEDIYKAGNYLFITSMNTIKVYNASDLTFKKDITHNATTGFARTIDGTLWAANGNKLIRIDTTTLSSEEVELPNDQKVFYNSFAYTPTGLSASTTENVLYFAEEVVDGWTINGKDIYKYNTETNTVSRFFAAPDSKKSVYGAGIQVDPRNGDVYIIYTEDEWGEHYLNTNIYVADGVTGNQKDIIDYTGTYWFPSTITFQ